MNKFACHIQCCPLGLVLRDKKPTPKPALQIPAGTFRLPKCENASAHEGSGGTKHATLANMPLLHLQSSEGEFTTSREIEPIRRVFCRRRSCTFTEVARLVPSGRSKLVRDVAGAHEVGICPKWPSNRGALLLLRRTPLSTCGRPTCEMCVHSLIQAKSSGIRHGCRSTSCYASCNSP